MLNCPICRQERRSLATEWRGLPLHPEHCPICAEEAVRRYNNEQASKKKGKRK